MGLFDEFEAPPAKPKRLFDEFAQYDTPPKSRGLNPAEFEPPQAGRTTSGVARDVGVTALKGLQGLQQSIIGLADLTTGGAAGWALERVGIDGKRTQQQLDAMYSAPQQEANRKVREADGFVDTLGAALENPSVIATTVGESVPQMAGGAAVARGVMGLSKAVAPWAAGAIGEGVMGGGSAAESIRQESEDGLLSGKQTLAALGSGGGTALFGAAGGKLMSKFGWGDIDTILARGGPEAIAAGTAKRGFIKQIAASGISEGVFEELPQSVQEQMWQNHALGKPVTEGVGNAAALGMLAGTAMGGAAGGYNAAMQRNMGAEQPPNPQAAPPVPASPVPAIGAPDATIVNNPSTKPGMFDEFEADATADPMNPAETPRAVVETVPPRGIVEYPQRGNADGLPGQSVAEVAPESREGGRDFGAPRLSDDVVQPAGYGMDPAAGMPEPGSGSDPVAGDTSGAGAVELRDLTEGLIRQMRDAKQMHLDSNLRKAIDRIKAGGVNEKPAYFAKLAKEFEKRGDPKTAGMLGQVAATLKARQKAIPKPAAPAVPKTVKTGVTTADEFSETSRKQFLRMVKQMGGVSTEFAADITGEPANQANRILPGFFSTRGNHLDLIARRLHEAGYLTDAEYDSVDGGVERTRELLGQALAKEFVGTPDQRQTLAELEAREADAAAELQSAQEQAELAEILGQDVTEADFNALFDGVPDAAQEQENDAAETSRIESQAGEAVARGAAAREEGSQGQPGRAPVQGENAGQEARPDLSLAQQTERDLIEREAALNKREAEQNARERAALDKEKADRERGDFTLTGSDRAADANAGQGDLLAAPNEEARNDSPVAESQAPDTESGDAGVAPGRAAVSPQQKEPWQMTRREWEAARESVRPNVVQSDFTRASASGAVANARGLERLLYGVTSEASEKLKAAQRGDITLSPEDLDAITERLQMPVSHEDVVRKAVADGKAVPDDVLAEYPEHDAASTMFSRATSTRAAYERRIDALFSGDSPRRLGARVLGKSDVLDMLGYGTKAVHVAEGKVVAGQYNHGLTAEHWKKIPEWLDNPAAVFDSDTVPGRLVFIAPETVNGSPVRMVVEPNARDGDAVVHLLVNAYDATGRTPFARWVDDGLLRYFSKAKSLGLRGTSGLQLPRVTTHLNQGSKSKIYTDADLVKYRKSELPGVGSGTIFSRGHSESARDAGPVSQVELDAVINRVAAGWKRPQGDGGRLIAVDTVADLPVAILRAADAQNVPQEEIKGVFHNGHIYLVRENHADARAAEETIFHEAYGHYGARLFFGPDGAAVQKALVGLWDRIGALDGVRKMADKFGVLDQVDPYIKSLAKSDYPMETKRRIIVDELLAHVAGRGEFTLKEQAKAYVGALRVGLRNAARKMGLDGIAQTLDGYTDSELLWNLKQMRAAVVSGKTGKGNGTLFARRAPSTDAFKEWNGLYSQSKAKGVFYHKTRGDFNQFDPAKRELGFHFGTLEQAEAVAVLRDNPEGTNIMPVRLSVKNPLRLKDEGSFHADGIADQLARKGIIDKKLAKQINAEIESDWKSRKKWDEVLRKSIQDAGYDGIVYKNEHEAPGDSWIVFEPTQIKSAIGNNGDYNAANPDIRFSRKVPAGPNSPQQPIRMQNRPGFTVDPETRAEGIQRRHQDKMNRWAKVQRQIKEQGGTVELDQDVYHAMERMTGRAADRIDQFTHETVRPLLKRIADLNTNFEEVGTYLMALGAKDRNDYIQTIRQDMPDNGSGLSNQEAAQIIADYRKRPDFAKFDALARDFQKLTERKLKVLAGGGVISQQQAADLTRAFGFYVPFKGFETIDEDGNRAGGTGAGYSTPKRFTKQAFGRVSKAGQVVENIIRDYEQAVILAEKANVGRYARNLAQANPDPTLWTVDQPPSQPSLVNGHVQLRQATFDNENEIRFIEGGKEVRIQLHDPLLAQTYNNLGQEPLSFLMKAGDGLNRFLRQTYTQKNPAFILVNAVRDVQTGLALMTAEMGAKNAIKALRHTAGAFKAAGMESRKRGSVTGEWAKYMDAYRKSGAQTAYYAIEDIEAKQAKLHELMAREGGGGFGWAWKQHGVKGLGQMALYRSYNNAVVDVIEALNGGFENMMRLSAFRQYIDDHGGLNGASKETLAEASRIAKNLTVNFNRKGEKTRGMNALYLFWNANVQGTQNLYRAAMSSAHKGQVRAVVGGMVGLGFLMAMATDEDDDELTPDYLKDTSIVIHIGDGKRIQIPLAYGLGAFVAMGYEMGMLTKGARTPMRSAMNLLGTTLQHFSPLGNPIHDGEADMKDIAVAGMPTILKVPTMLATNRNGMGYDVVPKFDDEQPDRPAMRNATRGGVFDKAAGGLEYVGLDVSPESLKLTSQFLTGGLGTFLSDSATALMVGSKGEFDGEKTPILKRFYGENDVEEYRSRFYEQANDVKQQASAQGKKQKEFFGSNKARDSVKDYTKQMKELRAQESAAQDAGKRGAAERIQAKQIRLSDAFKREHDRMVKRGLIEQK